MTVGGTTVCERHVLVDDVRPPASRVGDLLGVPATGAYCCTKANNDMTEVAGSPLYSSPTVWPGSRRVARPGPTRSRGTSIETRSDGIIARAGPAAQAGDDDDGGGGTDTGEGELARSIGLFQLSMFGIGATIGTGIFIVLTIAVPVGGPAVIVSFVIAGIVAGLTAICYAELASAVPVSGSSYSYAYATLGEGVAMVVAACLLLEYGVSSAAVAVGWSQYLNELFDNLFGFTIPESAGGRARAGRRAQPARRDPDRTVRVAADPWRQRIGEGQRGDGADQARRARALRRAGAAGLELRQPVGLRPVRLERDHLGGRPDLLLLHRAGRRLHRRRGGQESAADHAAGDHHRADHGDHGLHRRRRRRRRRAAPTPSSRDRMPGSRRSSKR